MHITSKLRLCSIAKVGLLLLGPALSSLRMRSTPGCSHKSTCVYIYKHIKGLYWVMKGPHVTRF